MGLLCWIARAPTGKWVLGKKLLKFQIIISCLKKVQGKIDLIGVNVQLDSFWSVISTGSLKNMKS